MPTATHTTTAPSRRSALGGFSVAALAAGLRVPAMACAAPPVPAPTPIALLNRQLQNAMRENLRLDVAQVGLSSDTERDAMQADLDRSLDEILDLRDRIAKVAAETVEDAAVQSSIAYSVAEGLNEYMDAEEIAMTSRSLRTLMASMLTVLAKAAGKDIDDVAHEMGHLCVLYAPGGECAA